MENVFIKGEVPVGSYVAVESAENPVVIGKGKDPVDAYREAQANGCKSPLLLYVPENDSVFVYYGAH